MVKNKSIFVINNINRCKGEMMFSPRMKVCKVNIDISKEVKPLHMKFKHQRECYCRCKCKSNIKYKGSSTHNERQSKKKAASVGEERIQSKRNSSTNNNKNNIALLSFKADLNEASKTMIDYNKKKQSKESSCSKGLLKNKMTMSLSGFTTHKKKIMNHTLNKTIKFGNNALQQGRINKDNNNIKIIKSIESNCNNNNKVRSNCMSPLNQSVKVCTRKYYSCRSLSQERSKRNALKTQDTKLIELHNKIKKISALIQGTENETSPSWLKSPKLINRIRTKKKIEDIYKKIHVS